MYHLYLKQFAHWDPVIHLITVSALIICIVIDSVEYGRIYSNSTQYRLIAVACLFILTVVNSVWFLKAKQLGSYFTRRIIIFYLLSLTYGAEGYFGADKKSDTFLRVTWIIVSSVDIICRLSLTEQLESQFLKQLRDVTPKEVFTQRWTLAGLPLRALLYLQTAILTWKLYLFGQNAIYSDPLTTKDTGYYILSFCILSVSFSGFMLNLVHLLWLEKKNLSIPLLLYRFHSIGSIPVWICILLLNSYRPIRSRHFHLMTFALAHFWLLLSNFLSAHIIRYVTYATLEKTLPIGEYAPYFQNLDSVYTNDARKKDKNATRFLKEIKIPGKKLTVGDEIGRGHFGKVHEASLSRFCRKTLTLAVKVLHTEGGQVPFSAVLSELKIMHAIGSHKFLVRLYGVSMIDGSYAIITELCPKGSLLSYVKSLTPSSSSCMLQKMLNWSEEIAEAMLYLGSRSIIHGDLAARNVLLDTNIRCKVSDFGMSLTLYNYQVYARTDVKAVPYRWMAPEILKDLKFSAKSDVYSYGVLLWEVFSFGGVPWECRQSPSELLTLLENGAFLPCPQTCSIILYESLMKQCWNLQAERRPSFECLIKQISLLKENYVRKT